MRFNEITTSLLEIDDDTVLEYIKWADTNKDGKYSISDFIYYLETEYCIGDFEQTWEVEYDLKQSFFIDELNRVKDDYND